MELYTYPAWERDGLLVRFDSPPTCARLNWDESFVAIGSQEGTLKVVEMESPHRFKIFEGHSGPILDVQYDPSEVSYYSKNQGWGNIVFSPKNFLKKFFLNFFFNFSSKSSFLFSCLNKNDNFRALSTPSRDRSVP